MTFYFHKKEMDYFKVSQPVSLILTRLPTYCTYLSELLTPCRACFLKPRLSLSTRTGNSSLPIFTLVFSSINSPRDALPPSLASPNTGLIYRPVKLPGSRRQVISITLGILCNKGIRCKDIARGEGGSCVVPAGQQQQQQPEH